MPLSAASEPAAFVRLAAHPLRWAVLTELARSDLRVRELVARTRQPQNLVSYHLRLLRAAGLVDARRSNADARDSYYHLDLDSCADAIRSSAFAIHPALLGSRTGSSDHPRLPRLDVLVACTGNSAQSPIAAALLRHRSNHGLDVVSAGSHPKPRLHPLAVRALHEQYGIDVADQRPRDLDTLAGHRFDYVITVCDKVREVCPDFGGSSEYVHWSVPDPCAAPAGHQPEYSDFVRTAADIDRRVRHLLATFTPKEALP
ncbi:arsenate reductase/protein-tyrosine-phosphatase family protein [Microlunatus ginsengisoli]|uniref:ArsR family transcriptional regulator n=1 Tax=Microlunatus ginsengisoli TaxID=363863 RepID=A0ABP6ZAW7_9ACTN